MMARGHALSGAAVWLSAAPPASNALGHPLSGPAVLAGAVVTTGASLIPDLDSGRSTPAWAFGWRRSPTSPGRTVTPSRVSSWPTQRTRAPTQKRLEPLVLDF